MRLVLIAGILWIGFTAGTDPLKLPQFGPDAAVAGGNGNGNGGGGNGNGGNGNAGNNGKGKAGQSDSNFGQVASTKSAVNKDQNLSSELKSLNSLNRNLNGLLNSADPKMDQFREAVKTGEPVVELPTWSEEMISWIGVQVDAFVEGYNNQIENGDPTPDP